MNGVKTKVYVASSWRNHLQQLIVDELKAQDFEVYDFRNPCEGDEGFHWSEIDIRWREWTPKEYRSSLESSITATRGFTYDYVALNECDICVLVNPCGRSAHLEAGYAIGKGKPTIIYVDKLGFEPELMYKMANKITVGIEETVKATIAIREKLNKTNHLRPNEVITI